MIKKGNPAEFTVDAYPEERFEGVVTQVRLAAIELQNVVTYTVIIEAANDDRRLFPGMTANVQIETAKRRGVMRISNDALRFKPRDQAVERSQGGAGKSAERAKRVVEQMKNAIKLTDEQVTTVTTAIRQAAAERVARRQSETSRADTPADSESTDRGARDQVRERIESGLGPSLSAEQKVLLERWQKTRKTARMGTIWVLGPERKLERRQVRLGISDEQHVEILGGSLKPGDRVVTRTRQAAKR